MSEPTFRRCYRILGSSPTVTLDALRLSYRRRVRATHPDRFQFYNPALAAALEAEFKQVVFAYRQLTAYVHRHGHLPDPDLPLAGSLAIELPPDPVPPAPPAARRLRPGPALWVLVSAVAAVSLAIGYRIGVRDNPAVQADAAGPTARLSMGMPMQDVVAIEGVPTQTLGPRWFYGDSVVLLANGSLVGWESRSPLPLHAAPDCAYALPFEAPDAMPLTDCRVTPVSPTERDSH